MVPQKRPRRPGGNVVRNMRTVRKMRGRILAEESLIHHGGVIVIIKASIKEVEIE